MNAPARLLVLLPLALVPCACSGDDAPAAPSSDLPERYLLVAEPASAQPVGAAHESAEDGEHVVVVGRVGGSADAFVSGVAAFTIVDPALDTCEGDGSGCPTPWDYCCEEPSSLAAHTATVEFRDGETLLTSSPRGFHGLDHLATVVVEGTAKRDAQGNLTVVADGVHVRG
jgi:hypothetical protein